MNRIRKKPLTKIGYDFIDHKYLPEKQNEYYIRNKQLNNTECYRTLSSNEITVLKENNNTSENWDHILVTNRFDPHLVKNNSFFGLVRIGDLEHYYLEFHDSRQPVGIYNSQIISCDIGSNVAINNVALLSHYIIRNEVILQNIDEMITTNYAKFGNGILKEGENENIRIWIEICNENGGRKVVPFDNMLPGDAWLWSRYRDRKKLMDSLLKMTQNHKDTHRGYYGTIESRSVIKHCRILKDVKIGSDAYIKGSNKLKNLTIKSSAESPSQIGEGVELVNGIIGFGCHIFYGVKAVRFIMDDYTNLKYGAKLINSYIGSNSTISCCEVLNSLIFPGHEQHHNNSFLCAATIFGQSNLASGATIGSNHNSRGNDGEIIAGRGFWPGLCTSLKHNSRFASFNLLVKGAYPGEIDNPLPFSLLSNTENELLIIPAYWFAYNMYALARNSWKYENRDQRKIKNQNMEFDYLAPDTVNEILQAMTFLEERITETEDYKKSAYTNPVDYLLKEKVSFLYANNIEYGNRSVKILKPSQAYILYRDFVHYYAVRTLIQALITSNVAIKELLSDFEGNPPEKWVNMGGQLIPERNLEELIKLIEEGSINSWEEIHNFYLEQGETYIRNKGCHALFTLKKILNLEKDENILHQWETLCLKAIEIQKYIAIKTRETRKKDYTNEFRNMVYRNTQERDVVLGKLEENSFIKYINQETEQFEKSVLYLFR